ncbi:hypothetical protein RR47_GL002159 [Enterococcus columbae DSM 7374 = ATCC 51263]|nr:hypothetical protein RR47_GL002159 [Enterococcus columbae DSM 7374 = ATCC 51263]
MAIILGLIGTLLSVNFLPVNPKDLTPQQIDYLMQEGTINYELGKKLQVFALVFLAVYVYFLLEGIYALVKKRKNDHLD